MLTDTKKTKQCHGCQADLPMDAKKCPHCHASQLTSIEIGIDHFVRTITPFKRSPATMSIMFAIITYFIVISIDIITHPAYGIHDALVSPPGEIIYSWGAHLRGELIWWRLITANFVHFGIIHILFNGIALRYVGPYVERAFGAAMTFGAFILLGTLSMLCSNIFGDAGIVAGASGGLMGFIGMAAIAAHREKTQLSLKVRNSMISWAVYTFIFGIIMKLIDGMGIDNIAHVSGFLFGLIAGFILPVQSLTGFTKVSMIRGTRITAFLAFVTCLLSFFFLGNMRLSYKHLDECIVSFKLNNFNKANDHCAMAYEKDKTNPKLYLYYIQSSIITGNIKQAQKLCEEARKTFKQSNDNAPPLYDEICKSVNR